MGQIVYWLGGGGAFTDDDDWTDNFPSPGPAAPPGADDIADFAANGTVEFSGNTTSEAEVGAAVVFDLSGGGYSVGPGGAFANPGLLSNQGYQGSPASLEVTGANTLAVSWINFSAFDEETFALTITGGARLAVSSTTQPSFLDSVALSILGGAELDFAGPVTLDQGDGAESTLTIADGTLSVDALGATLGSLSISDGDISAPGGLSFDVSTQGTASIATSTIKGALTLDSAEAGGALTIQGVTVSGSTTLGSSSVSITGTDGFGGLSLGLPFGVAGTDAVSVSAATVTVNGNLSVGKNTTATLTGSRVSVTGQMTVGGMVSATGSQITVGNIGAVPASGTLTLLGNVDVAANGSETAVDALTVLSGGSIELGGSAAAPANTLQIANGASLVGHGLVTGAVTGNVHVSGASTTPTYSLNINDQGKIGANNGLLVLNANVQGDGIVQVTDDSSVELGGSVGDDITVNMDGAGAHDVILDNPVAFHGTISGLTADDVITLSNTNVANGDAVVYATIGDLNGVQTLQIAEGDDVDHQVIAPINIRIQGPNDTRIPTSGADEEFFDVTRSANGDDTILTLEHGNPIDLAVNGPAARNFYGVTGAGVTVGVISNSFNFLGGEAADIADDALPGATNVLDDQFGSDEGRAMAELIHDIAPGAAIDFDPGVGDPADLANAIAHLQAAGCEIIVDDLGVPIEDDTVGGVVNRAIDDAVASGITYVTSTGNDREHYAFGGRDAAPAPVYGHKANPLAFSVAAMNYLATPTVSPVGGYQQPPATEPFSSLGATDAKPDITGPDGGPTTLPITVLGDDALDPFFGTSAAAPAVAGVVALMMQENPGLEADPLLVYHLLEATASDFGEAPNEMGAGLVQAAEAVGAAETAAITVGNGNASSSLAVKSLAAAPAVKSMMIVPATGDVDTNTKVQIILTMTTDVTVSAGAPSFTLNDGGTATYNAAVSNPAGATLVFDYTVGAGDPTASLELTKYNPNGATVDDSQGDAASFSGALDIATGLTINSPLKVSSVFASETGEAATGEKIELTIALNGAFTLDAAGGNPTLTLDNDATATYDSSLSSPSSGKLVFDYTPAADDEIASLSIFAVNLPKDTTVENASGDNADFSGALHTSLGLQVGPAFVEAVNSSEVGEANTGQTLELTIDMSEAVAINTSAGSPTLTLNDGGSATYNAAASDPSGGVLAFDTTIAAGDQTADLAATALVPNGAVVNDPYGKAADFTGAYGFDMGVSVNVGASSSVVGEDKTLAYSSAFETVFRPSADGGTLKIVNGPGGAAVDTVTLTGAYSGGFFTVSANGAGTNINYTPTAFDDVGASGDVLVGGVSGQSYSAYQNVYDDGVYVGVDYYYTDVAGPYTEYEYRYASGGAFIGSEFLYLGVPAGADYSEYEYDYDGAGQVTGADFSGVDDAPYTSYQYDYVGGVFAGSEFTYTTVPSGVTYSSYEADYNQANAFAGLKFFFDDVVGEPYTGEEEDFDADEKLSRILLTGVEDQAYSSLELDYSAGVYAGYKAYYAISGKSFANEEVDVSASGQLEKVVYSGLTGTPYASVEQDYSNGALADVIYGYDDVKGETYYAYQVTESAGGAPLQETFDLSSGGHTLIALSGGQILTSLGNDKMTGDGVTTFVLDPIYRADTITNLTSADKVSMSSSEFADFAALQSAAAQSGANIVITATDGDTLTLKNLTIAALASMSNSFTFNA